MERVRAGPAAVLTDERDGAVVVGVVRTETATVPLAALGQVADILKHTNRASPNAARDHLSPPTS